MVKFHQGRCLKPPKNCDLIVLSLSFALLMLIFCSQAYAVPAAPVDDELFQPDGTKIKLRLRGDEFRNWRETEEGYSVIQDRVTEWWHYAVPDEVEGIVIGPHKVGRTRPDELDIRKGLKPVQKRSRKISQRTTDVTAASVVKASPSARTQQVLVILVDFLFQAHRVEPATFQKLFFGSSRSVAGYYNEVSYGNFTIVPATESYDGNDGVVGWLTLSGYHPNCYSDDYCAAGLAAEAVKAASQYVHFPGFDTDGNKKITPEELSIIIVVAGYEAAYGYSTPSVWAHQGELFSQPVSGLGIKSYAMFGEMQGDHTATLGVMVHELGHLMLDLPDLYDTEAHSTSEGIGRFDVMSGGSWCYVNNEYRGETPVHPSAWTKQQSGFITPLEITSQTGVSMPAASGSSEGIFKVPTQDEKQYFLIENRYFTGYDLGLQGCLKTSQVAGGLAVWHVDEAKLKSCVNYNNCNNDETHKLVDLEEAHKGLQDLDYYKGASKLNALFYAGNMLTFNDLTVPNSRLYNGSSTGISVTNISKYGEIMTADIFSGGDPRFTLTVAKSGPAGIVTNSGLTVDCGADCVEVYKEGEQVTLSAAVTEDNIMFMGWSGGCSGKAAKCTLTINSDVTVTATFAPATTLNITRTGEGDGLVTTRDNDIDCGLDCEEFYKLGSYVTLFAAPDSKSVFSGWGGDGCASVSKTCKIKMKGNKNVSAIFDLKKYTITASSGRGGSIYPSGKTLVSYGGQKTYTVTPLEGYEISYVKADGQKVDLTGNTYTFPDVTKNHKITAGFKSKAGLASLSGVR